MRLLKKALRYLLITIVLAIVSVNLYVVLSGRFYLYKGVVNTYLIGQSGPGIYDKDVFHSAQLKAGNEEKWIFHEQYNTGTIPAELRTYIEDLGTTGYLVFYRDSLLYEEYWDDHKKSTLSNSFSMAKTVVGLLIGIAVEEGKIKKLDDKVVDYLPEFKGGGREKITIRHLLTMSSGLSWSESGDNPLSDNAEGYYGWNTDNLAIQQDAIHKPGEVFRYQGGNTQLLAMIAERVTGKHLTEYAQEKIWSKIGASRDAYWSLDEKDGSSKAFCCLYATSRDFAKLGKLLLHQGKAGNEQVIPEWYYAEMIRPASLKTKDGCENRRYGFHIWTYFGMTNPVYYYRGLKGQYIIAIPKEELLIVRVGHERKSNFSVPEHLQGDKEYIEQNKDNLGHSPDLFQYIALGKMIKSQSK